MDLIRRLITRARQLQRTMQIRSIRRELAESEDIIRMASEMRADHLRRKMALEGLLFRLEKEMGE